MANLSPPNFWTNNKAEPKRSFRWVGYINLFGPSTAAVAPVTDASIPGFLIKSFDRPTFNLPTEKLLNNFTSETQLNTQHYTWEDVSIVMYDLQAGSTETGFTGGNTTQILYEWMVSMGFEPQQTIENLSELFTNIADNALGLKIASIDHAGKEYESWTFNNARPIKINYGGTADYDSDALSTISMDIAYSSATYEKTPLNN